MTEELFKDCKKFIRGFIVATLVVIASACSTREAKLPCSCPQDSMVVTQPYSIDYGSFASVQEILDFQNNWLNSYAIEDIFLGMDVQTLTNVATVCLKKTGPVTIRELVLEYRKNADIYNNLSPTLDSIDNGTETTAVEETTAMEEQQLPAPKSVSYHYEIDTVDGKPTKVLVKEERYESK